MMETTRYLHGFVAPGFERVAAALEGNLRQEAGISCAIYQRGELVLDVSGGVRDGAGNPWLPTTLVPVYSVSKGIASLCLLHLVDQGLLCLDAPVAQYWPAFSTHGKERVTVREALAHRGGIPYLDCAIALGDLVDTEGMEQRLASQAPIFTPGGNHCYHPVTFGWIVSALVRSVTGQSLGAWIATHLAPRLSLDLWLGLPEQLQERVAFLDVQDPAVRATWPQIMPPGSLAWKACTLNGLLSLLPGMDLPDFNDPRIRAVELAGANMVTRAGAIARCYAAALGPIDGFRLVSEGTLEDACRLMSSGVSFDGGLPGASWAAGLMVPWANQPMLGPRSFGHDGFGGQLAFADPDSGISFAYLRNRLATTAGQDPLVYNVVDALRSQLNTNKTLSS